MEKLEYLDRDGGTVVTFVVGEVADAIGGMREADGSGEVGPAIARAMAVSARYGDREAFEVAAMASEELAIRMGVPKDRAVAGSEALRAKHFGARI